MAFPKDFPDEWLERANKLGVFEEDIREEFVRGSGAGGQKINKTSNCVWLRHKNGLEVRVQRHREREKNRVSAYKLLIKKVEDAILGKQSENAQKRHKYRKQKQRRSRKAQAKVVDAKRARGQLKKDRSSPAES
jgi:protein subunit release factor B